MGAEGNHPISSGVAARYASPPKASRKRGAKLKFSPQAAGLADELGTLLHMPPGKAVVQSMEIVKALVRSGKIKIEPRSTERMVQIKAREVFRTRDENSAGTAEIA